MYGSSFMCVTARPRASISAPMDAEVSPLPMDETTPPVTRTNLVRRFTVDITEDFRITPWSPSHPKRSNARHTGVKSRGIADRNRARANVSRVFHARAPPIRSKLARDADAHRAFFTDDGCRAQT